MANTRFMERMFSATENQEEEVLNQVAGDIEEAKKNGSVDTDELKYEKVDDNKVAVTDKATNETTIAETSEDGNVDLYNPEDELVEQADHLDGYLHPEVGDEVVPGDQKNPTEEVEDHVTEEDLENVEYDPEEECAEGECPEEEKEFSVYSDNTVIQKIFSNQEYCEMLFSDVIVNEDVEDVAKVGNLKIEKVDDDTVIVSDLKSGDQAKVTLDDEEMEVEELGHKDFSDDEECCDDEAFEPLHIVGVDTGNHQLVDTVAYDDEDAEEIATRLTDAGVDAVEIFECPEKARDYAADLLDNLGVESEEDVEEPEEATFSDVDGSFDVYVTRYFSTNTVFMDRLFSEADNGIEISQAKIEDAIENGDEIETENEIVTPISATEAVVEDKDEDEFTKVTIDGDEMKLDPLTKEEAEDLVEDIAVSEDEVDEDEDEADEAEDEVEDAEDDAEQKEEDEEEEEDDEKDEEDENEEAEEKDYSEDIYSNDAETKFFSENEPMTDYMVRLFSDEEDEELIEKAIEEGDQIENDSVVITPVDKETAVIEDKENGEFTKAVMSDEDLDVTPISEEEADDLTEDLAVSEDEEEVKEDGDEEEKSEEEKEDEKKFSGITVLDKWFADVVNAPAAIQPQAQAAPQAAPAQAPAEEAPAVDENGNPVEEAPVPSVEAIEDKAIAAVQQIQAAAAEAEAAIMNAKAAPVENQEADLQEATFSETETEKTFSEENDTLVSWLDNLR